MKERAYTLYTSGRSGSKRRHLNEGKSGMAAADGQTCQPAATPSARPSTEATGLSKSQNRTHGGPCIPERRRITVYHGAGLLELESRPRGDAANCSQERRRPRGKIHSWSAKSRMRCRKLLQSLERKALTNSWFLTTTYPSVFPAPDDQAVYLRAKIEHTEVRAFQNVAESRCIMVPVFWSWNHVHAAMLQIAARNGEGHAVKFIRGVQRAGCAVASFFNHWNARR